MENYALLLATDILIKYIGCREIQLDKKRVLIKLYSVINAFVPNAKIQRVKAMHNNSGQNGLKNLKEA